ncbi:MAG: AmmeMemoRadiSam system radical SAM enzyme [Bacteroidota bacterium]|nr:AmmeMemoRadiSam system radical SAM enzyme [Bacteroidota bacterium]
MKPLFLPYDKYTECRLCPHFCKIAPGRNGICGVRKNSGDRIELVTYGVISGFSLDPVEKKPLYHFFPGYNILSIGSYGCNMRCDFCQNWQISQKNAGSLDIKTDPDKIVAEAENTRRNIGLAFTYNEPIVWFEFMRDVAVKIKGKGLFTAMVSNGFVNRDPLDEIIGFIDAFNIDLKAFNEEFYKRLTGAELGPVKESLKQISKAGRHLEITTLVIPGRNDSEQEMEAEAKWIAQETGIETPLHLSRYFPMYKRDDPATPQETLTRLYNIASKYLKHVYMGNTLSENGQDTACSKCGTIVTRRSGYNTRVINLDNEGRCAKCSNQIYRYFNLSSHAER